MAFLYALLRGLTSAFRMAASFRLTRAKRRYESAEEQFRKLETDCKAHEVEVGRPVGFGEQLGLLKAYETRERHRSRWMNAQRLLDKRLARERWFKELNGRKLPYSFGLVDMASLFYLIDRFGGGSRLVHTIWEQLAGMIR